MPLSEVLQSIRVQYERNPPKQLPFPHRRVLTRSADFFITESQDDWHCRYERRKRLQTCGFFSVNTSPYRTFGEIKHLGWNDLVKEHLKIVTDSSSMSDRGLHKTELNPNLHSNVIRVARTFAQKKAVPKSKSGGFSHVTLELGGTQRGMQSTRAGTSFLHMIEEEERRKVLIRETKKLKLRERDGRIVKTHNPSVYLSQLVPSAVDKMCLVKTHINQLSNGAFSLVASDWTATPKQGSTDIINNAECAAENCASPERCRKLCLAKLQSICALLCCVSSIKTKDIRSKEPLSPAAIRALCRKLAQNYKPKYLAHSTHSNGEVYKQKLCVNLQRHSEKVRTSQETTEDTSDELRKHIQRFNSQEIGRHVSSVQVIDSSISKKIVPAWQRQIIYVEDENHQLDMEGQLKETIAAFRHMKGTVALAAMTAIKKRHMHLRDHLSAKMVELTFGLGSNAKEALTIARKKAFMRTNVCEAAKMENNPIWLQQLEKEVHKLFGDSDTNVKHQLDRLRMFVDIDGRTPLVIEKLCYLVMSLPVHHLCVYPVVTAIEFVLEHVLNTSPKLCQQWFEIRRLPFVMKEVTDQSHLFGLIPTV